MFAPNADVFTLGFCEVVPSLLFGGGMVDGYYLLNCSVRSTVESARVSPRDGKSEEKRNKRSISLVCLLRHYLTRVVLKKKKKKRLRVLGYHEFKEDSKAKISVYISRTLEDLG